ncbi:PCRF domain-containing protein, partial [Treponema sp. R6D11]
LNAELSLLKNKSTEQDFYNNIENSRKVLKNINIIENKIQKFENLKTLTEEIEILISMAEEEETNELNGEIASKLSKLENQSEKFRLETLLSGPYDANNCLITIHPGAGGTESCDWAD